MENILDKEPVKEFKKLDDFAKEFKAIVLNSSARPLSRLQKV